MKRNLSFFETPKIFENADYTVKPSHSNWEAFVWENIVFITTSGIWKPEHWAVYFGFFWNIFIERRSLWAKVYFVYDTSNLPIQNEEFRTYLKENWVHLLEREDYCLSIIEPNALKRTIWKSIYRLINIQNKIHLFKDHPSTFQWILKDRSKSTEKAGKPERKPSLPEELNVEWVRKHAHIHLTGKDKLWSIMTCRNIVLLQIRNYWTPENIREYMNHISGLPLLLLEEWKRIFLIFDVTRMNLALRDARKFLKLDWLRFLDWDHMITCVVQQSSFKRFLWRRLLRQIGKLNRVRIFPDCDLALAWIRDDMIKNGWKLQG